MDKESLINQRVRSGVPALVDQDGEAFCSTNSGGTVVISVSEREFRDLKMKEDDASIKEGQ